jgi:hypothetical protein
MEKGKFDIGKSTFYSLYYQSKEFSLSSVSREEKEPFGGSFTSKYGHDLLGKQLFMR